MSLAFCRREGFPLESARSVLCAVSGGVDSMCLLHLLWRQSQSLGFALSAATFDHQLRPASGADAAFVAGWCQERGIPCRTGGGDVAEYARSRDMTLEEAGRTLRYSFLEQCRRELGAEYLATAHNADDNAETLLLHLLRGTGLNGLGGIPPRREAIIRPLLCCTRREIESYCAQFGVPHREDESNQDTAYTRNYLRHTVLPLLREKNPALTGTLARTAETLRLDEAFLARETERAAAALLRQNGGQVSVSAAQLRALDPALALRLVQVMAERAAPGAVLPQNQRQALLELARRQKNGKISLINRLQGRLVYDMLTLSLPVSREPACLPFTLLPGACRDLPALGCSISCEETVCSPDAGQASGALLLRPPAEGALLVRSRQIGDRITLAGRPEKTLKKLFQERRLPPEDREQVPVLILEGQVAAVAGFGVDVHWRPLPGQPAWRILWTKTDTQKKGLV